MSFVPFDSEMESYFDFDQGFHSPSMSRSPLSGFAPSDTIDPLNMVALGPGEQRPAFNGPSHEYGLFRQLTGLPNGAVSNVTALNEIEDNFSTPTQMSYNTGITFEMEDYDAGVQEPLPPYFFANDSSSMREFVSPTTVTGRDLSTPRPTTRLYPGMHSQQAEQAKAEAFARQQRQQQMGQQLMQQRHQQHSRSGSTQTAISKQGGSSGSTTTTDPVVEERISRLLDQMRHNSTVSSIEEEADSPGGENGIRGGRSRKDEEDMDEDERLLASEEGKKLSSKERRQLRNKVSARAFRSRRKEYIGQLEGELAVKSNECSELKARNRNLSEQNQQLTRLTQTLLRHPAFGTFLNEMSNDPSIMDTLQSAAIPVPPKQEPTTQSHDLQVNMANIPQSGLELSMLNLGNHHWNSNGPAFSFQQPQVYSVLELHQPSLDQILSTKLSGKPDFESIYRAVVERPAKLDAPKLEKPGFAPADLAKEYVPSCNNFDLDESDFGLFVDTPSRPLVTTSNNSIIHYSNATASAKHVTTPTADPVAAMREIETMFDSLRPTYRMIGALTRHLPL